MRIWRIMAIGAVVLVGPGLAGAQQDKDAGAGVAARMGDKTITLAEVDAIALGQNMKLAQSLHDARMKALDQLILERGLAAEAAAQGVSVDDLITSKLAEKATPITDAEIEMFYNARKAQMRGQPLEKMTPQIKQYLKSQNDNKARKALLDTIKKTAGITVVLDPPRAEVVLAANDPSWGSPDAKVTIVEYSDFQ